MGDIAEAMAGVEAHSSLPLDAADQQATVTDFLDYTEFYPSDLVRSLALIRQLDGAYRDASHKVHELTKVYGSLPSLPEATRPDPQAIRKQISTALDEAIHAREAAFAEASRLHENTERHSSRLAIIKRKLQALPEPPSRDPTPPPVAVSPLSAKKAKPEMLEHTPVPTSPQDDDERAPRQTSTARVQKHRARKRGLAVVPGEIMPPPNPESPTNSDMSGSEDGYVSVDLDSMDLDEGEAPGRVKIPRTKGMKIKGPKPAARTSRPPGVMGTNVHSQVAGISTSNALAALTPPPADAQPGSKWAPWHKLTEYEMAVLRKSMKKNAIWQPSDTMIRRELSQKGRGRENYERARALADESGQPFLDETPMDPNKEVLDPGETSFKPIGEDEKNLINRGMKLNEMKKLKREATLKEQEQVAVGQKMDEGEVLADEQPKSPSGLATTSDAAAKEKKEAPKSARKRKRDSISGLPASETQESQHTVPETSSRPAGSGPKKLKLQGPAPLKSTSIIPLPPSPPRPAPVLPSSTTSTIPILPAGRSSSAAPSQPPTRKGTPVPSPTSPKRPSMPSAGTRSRRTSVAPPKTSAPTPAPDTSSSRAGTPASGSGLVVSLNAATARRPTRATQSVKAASAEPPVKREPREVRELRRGSNVSLPSPADQVTTAVQTESAATAAAATTRMSQRRGKRPAPGLVTADEDGKSKVSVGKRKKPPSKKQSGQEGKQKQEGIGSEGVEDIDPDEPLYCLCNDVSWGTMIGCEGDDCKIEWFHISCVGLSAAPKKSVKWFCPDCRKIMHIDERGKAVDGQQAGTKRR